MWRRKDSSFAGTIGLPETGRSDVLNRLDPDVMLLLGQYRKLALGVNS
jgi:hypothetical protein